MVCWDKRLPIFALETDFEADLPEDMTLFLKVVAAVFLIDEGSVVPAQVVFMEQSLSRSEEPFSG